MALAPRAMNVQPGRPGVPTISFEEGWGMIEKNGIKRVQRIVEKRGMKISFKPVEFTQLYSVVYTMCTQKAPQNWSGKLYFAHRKSLEQYLTETVQPALMANKNNLDDFVRELHQRWMNHKVMVKWMVKIFAYVDRFYVPRLAIDDLNTVGMKAFQKTIFESCKDRAASAVVAMMARERNNASTNSGDHRMMKDITGMFLAMGMGKDRAYVDVLEKAILEAAAFESKRDATNWAGKYGLANYLQRAEARLEEETDRVHFYLHKNTLPKLMKVCEAELLGGTQDRVLGDAESGIDGLLTGYCRRDLLRLYRLYSRLPVGLECAAKHFRLYVTKETTQIMDNVTAPGNDVKELIDGLIKILSDFERLVTECFHDDSQFKEAVNSGFEQAMNNNIKGKKKMPELIADSLDGVLRTNKPLSARSGPAMAISAETKIDNIAKIFVYLRDKDVFGEVYRKLLAKRLLLGRARDDLEQRVTSHLKKRCGGQFTAKLEGMLTDMRLAADVQSDFEKYLRNPSILAEEGELASAAEDKSPQKKVPPVDPSRLSCELRVNVLTQGFWPTYKLVDFHISEELEVAKTIFESFYCRRTANRKLRWVHTLGSVVVQGSFRQSSYAGEMTMSTFQACILTLFNRWEALSTKGIAQHLKMEPKDVNKQLVPLVFGKFKILKLVGGGDSAAMSLKEDERVCINHSFTDNSNKIKIPLSMGKNFSKAKDEVIDGDVLERRKHQTESAIVKVMKDQGKCKHDVLVAAVVKRLSHLFQATADLIKPRIEDLISRDYMERDENDPTSYEYVA